MRFPATLMVLAGCLATAEPAPNPSDAAATPSSDTLALTRFLPAENKGGKLDVVVDARDPESGWLTITERITDFHLEPPLYFKPLGRSPEHEYEDFRAVGPKGNPIKVERDRGKWVLPNFKGTSVEVTYRAKPGGIGRHGHQGLIQPDWASFDGRVYLMPKGAMGMSEITLSVQVPDGWDVHTPFRELEDGRYSLDTVPDRVMFESLQTSCIALGAFDRDDRTYGDTDFRVAVYSGFPEEHKKLVFDKTHRMAEWFADKTGFDPGHPFMFAFLPMPFEDRVFGGAWANGACYEQPTDRLRNWELLGHRFAHPINKYHPSGMTLRDPQDHWFMEGWASYIELISTAETGIGHPDQRAWNKMWSWFVRERALHPQYDRALAKEAGAGKDAGEILHYAKGPLVVKLLDEEMRARTGKNMEQFFKYLNEKYGGHKAPIPLRDELHAFTGVSFEHFWARHVDNAGAIVPVWSASERMRPAAEVMAQEPPMAMVGGRRIHPTFLHYLTYSAKFERFAEIEDWLEEAVARRAELDRRGIRPWPAWMYEVEYGLHPTVQLQIMEAELAWPLHLEPSLPATSPARGGCGGGATTTEDSAGPEPRFTLIDGHPSSVIWKNLLQREQAYLGQLVHTGLEAIQAHRYFKQGDPPVGRPLGFGPKQSFVGMSVWLTPPDQVDFEIEVDGSVSMEKRSVLAEPGWHRTWLTMEDKHRPDGEKIVVLKVYADGELAGERAFWQRTLPEDP